MTGVSGSGKSTLVTQVLAEVVRRHLGGGPDDPDELGESDLELAGTEASGLASI